jgi:hypothetical protein
MLLAPFLFLLFWLKVLTFFIFSVLFAFGFLLLAFASFWTSASMARMEKQQDQDAGGEKPAVQARFP